MSAKILIVEDDTDLQSSLSKLLKSEGFITQVASTGSAALSILDRSLPNLVLLDLGLPDIQGESILMTIRKDFPELPVIILTAKSKPMEIAQGLSLGADDYLPKPFAVEELLARINARLHPRTGQSVDEITLSDLKIDLMKMTVTRGGKNIKLTKTEFSLFRFLVENAGRVLSRQQILNNVWGYSSDVDSRVVDVYMGYLRKKIDKGFKDKIIINKRGFGYLIDA